MKKTNTSRKMSSLNIEKSFNQFIMDNDAESLMAFVELYPHFTERYIQSLLDRIKVINLAISIIRENE